MENRLGDVIDDYCIKCRRLTNHSIVSMMEGEVAKVRCRSCYHEHDYLHEQIPPSRKDLKKAEMLAMANAEGGAGGTSAEQETESAKPSAGEGAGEAEVTAAAPSKSSRGRTRKA